VLVQELFERAKTRVLIAGFRFDHGAELFKPLHERMRRGLSTVFFVDIEGDNKPFGDGRAFAARAIDRFVAENWPFGPPLPVIYYDPQSAVAGPPWVSLHAKCIVIDEAVSLVTSANFTERGQTRNIEIGVCIEDREFAERLAAQWQALIARGLVERSREST
jgi:phosphatidylserine/phosphatidylglycerophosphate/cardiolipin synthase-like enzyme